MGIREQIGECVKSNFKPDGNYKFYMYPSDKIIRKIKKYYDKTVTPDCIVAFYDTSLMGSGKNGLVFTTTGVYYRGVMEKPFYFNYWDIDTITITDVSIAIVFSNGKGLHIYEGSITQQSLRNTLLQLKERTSSGRKNDMYSREVGTVGKKKVNLTDGQKTKCNTIIHGAATAAGAAGAGMAQFLVADAAVITPIQIGMVVALGDIFGFTVTEGLAKGIIKGAMAATVGRGAVQLLAGWIPGIGNAINTATAAGLTEAIGWMAVQEFYSEQVELISKDTFEAKFRRQADAFLNEKKVWFEEKKEYEKLLDECISHIKELETKIERKDGQIEKLEMELAKYRWYYERLSNLRVG